MDKLNFVEFILMKSKLVRIGKNPGCQMPWWVDPWEHCKDFLQKNMIVIIFKRGSKLKSKCRKHIRMKCSKVSLWLYMNTRWEMQFHALIYKIWINYAMPSPHPPIICPRKGKTSGLIYLTAVVRLHIRYVGGLLPTASSGNLAALHGDARDYQWLGKGSSQIKQIFSKVSIEFIFGPSMRGNCPGNVVSNTHLIIHRYISSAL